jgi:hypothetical protein
LPEQTGPVLPVILALVNPEQVFTDTLKVPEPDAPKNKALLLVADEAVLPQVPLYPPSVVFTVNVPAVKLFDPRLATTPVFMVKPFVTFVALVNVFVVPEPSKFNLLTTEGSPLPVF